MKGIRNNVTGALGIGVGLLLAFQNCSKVEFAITEQALRGKLNTGGVLVINNNEPYTTSQNVQVAIFHDSADEMYVTNDPTCESGGAWEERKTEKSWQLAQDNSVAKVFVKFREAGTEGVESTCIADDILHDNLPPSVRVTRGIAQYIKTQDASLDFVASDSGAGIDTVTCKDDGGQASPCTTSHSRSGLAEGNHNVTLVARDLAGNVSDPVQVNFAVDLTAPTVTLNSAPAKITASTSAEFTFSGKDSLSGIERYECRLGNGSFAACDSPFVRTVGQGPQSFAVRAVDKAGNVSEPKSHDWTVDSTAPSVRITKGPAANSAVKQGAFEFEGSDDGQPLSNFQCSVDGSAFVKCASPHTTAALADGQHTFAVRGLDAAGNGSAPANYSWLIDTVKPSVTITSRPDAVSTNRSATVAFTANDSGSGIARSECSLDGGAFATCDQSKTYSTLADGEHTISVQAIDKAGNVSEPVNVVFRVDTQKPTIEIVSGPTNPTASQSARFVMQVSDGSNPAVPRIECKVDGEADFVTCSSTKDYANLAEGRRTFTARAVDAAGNVSDPKSYNWLLDLTPPAINIGKQPLSTIGRFDQAVFSFSVTDSGAGVDKVQCGLDGNMVDCQFSTEQNLGALAVGTHRYTVTATDKLGNSSRQDVLFEVQNNVVDKSQDISVTMNNKVDVLVVVDNSGSMATEQSNMATRFTTFIDQLGALDWQIGIVTTDVMTDTAYAERKDGRLLGFRGINPTPYIVSSKMDQTLARKAFADTIQRKGETGSGNEQGIAASYRAIQRAIANRETNDSYNTALFRPEAALAVLVVSDANETNPSGTKVQNTPEGLVDLIRSSWGAKKPFTFHSIIVKPNDEACLRLAGSGNEGYGTSYDALSKLTGGVIGSVCASDYGSQLTAMGKATTDLVRSVTLECLPLDMNGDGKPDLSVQTSNNAQAPSFTIDGMKVTFSADLPVGTNRLIYSCLKQ